MSQNEATPNPQQAIGPSLGEVLLLALVACTIVISLVSLLHGYFALVDNFGDNNSYIRDASAIRHWNFQGLVVKHFWGLPYAMAAFSTLTRASDRTALLFISCAAYFVTVVLAYRLWGGWIAGFFTILNFDWMHRSFLGGSEPLFVALLFGSFWAARRERWLLAALLTSFATVVRPLGFFALAGVGITLLWRKEFHKLFSAVAIGLSIGFLYILPFARHFGDPFATVNSYHSAEWEGGWLFGFPFVAIVKGTLLYPVPWTNLALDFGWIFLVLAGVLAMIFTKSFREYAKAHPVEIIFAGPYLWCIYSYNYPYWARVAFPRFSIPILPFVFLALDRWWPKDRRVLWAMGIVGPTLAASSAVGIKNVVEMLRRSWG